MQINSHQSNTSFGNLVFTDEAKILLKKRLLTKRQADKIEELIKNQSKNPLTTTITAADHYSNKGPDQFVAYTTYTKYGKQHDKYMWQWEQNFIARLLSTPVRFIKKACKVADSLAKDVAKWNYIEKSVDSFPKKQRY